MLRTATPERLSAFSDGVGLAVLITVLVLDLRPPELPTFKALLLLWPRWLSYAVSYVFIADRLDDSPPSDALRDDGDAPLDVVPLRASVFRLAASTLHRLDGRERIGPGTRLLLCRGVLPRERDVHLSDLGHLLTDVPSTTWRRRCEGSCASDRSRPCVFSEQPPPSR